MMMIIFPCIPIEQFDPLLGGCIDQMYKEKGPADDSTDHVTSLIFVQLLFDVLYTMSLLSTISLLLSFFTFLLTDIFLMLPLLFRLLSILWFVILPFYQN